MIQKFRKKPIIIEAIQFGNFNFNEIVEWIGEDNLADGTSEDEVCIEIITLEGTLLVYRGDWIIKGIEGEFYPCKPSIFEKTYKLLEINK